MSLTRFQVMIFFLLCVGCQSIAPTDNSLGGTVELDKPEYTLEVEPTPDDIGIIPPRDEGAERDGDGLVIYFVDVSSSELLEMELSALECGGASIIAADDIVAYSWETHELYLTASANRRLAQLQSVIMEKCGLPFVVCVGNEPIYSGAVWTSYSSAFFEGIVIDVYPAEPNEPVRIQLGYPPGMFEDMVVKTALELDLFSTIGQGHHTLESISAAIQCHELWLICASTLKIEMHLS